MKTIFVTVTEFLNNGGIIETGRTLHKNIINNDFQEIGTFDFAEQIPVSYMVTVSNWNGTTFQMLADIVYVEIEVTPIYK